MPKSQAQKLKSQIDALQRQVAALKMPAAPAAAGKRRKRKRKSGSGSSVGTMAMVKHELCSTLSIPASSAKTTLQVSMVVGLTDCPPWLSKVGKNFEKVKYHSLEFEYVPGCAMTQAGRVTLGFDADWSNPATTRAQLSQYEPSASCAVYQNKKLVVPLNTAFPWYSWDQTVFPLAGPGKLIVMAEAQNASATTELVLGEIWVRYRVTLACPRYNS